MLSEEDKTRLHLEEVYRSEVRKGLENKSPKSFWTRLWSFLNSSFGLWIFSVLLVGSFVDNLKKEDVRREEEKKTIERVERLDSEIECRLSQTIQALDAIRDDKHPELLATGYTEGDTLEAARALLRPANAKSNINNDRLYTLYPEHRGFSTVALVAELKRHTREKPQLNQLNKIIHDMSGLQVLLGVEKADLKNPQSVAGVILKKFALPRWRKGGFYFLDCKPSDPFC